MSQSPNQPPSDAHATSSDLANPARRAGMLMIVVGLFFVLLAIGLTAIGLAVPIAEYSANVQEQIKRVEAEMGVSWATFLKIAAGIIASPAVLMMALGFFVRRGSMTSAVLGVVLTAVIALYLASVLVQSLFAVMTRKAQGSAALLVFSLAALALLGVLIFWLSKAVINAGPLKVFNQQYQAMQLEQQEQARN